jgi:hypothetical protein
VPPRKTTDSSPKDASKARRARGRTKASLFADLGALRKERDTMALQLETVRRTLAEITRLATADAETNNTGAVQALKLAIDAAQSIDVSALLAEIRSTARLEAGKDTARLNALDSLASDGGVGFGYEQIRGTFIRFTRITPAERTRIGFFYPPNALRTLLDEVIREERTHNQQKTIFVADCKPLSADQKRSRK